MSRWEAEEAQIAVPGEEANLKVSAVVVDGYDLPQHEMASLPDSVPVLSLADHGVGSELAAASLILDQNLGAEPAVYRSSNEGAHLLLGPRYALLRRDVIAVAAARESGDARHSARRLLVALGGHPDSELRSRVSEALGARGLRHLTRIDLEGLSETGPAMAVSDLAVSTAGSTAWELAATGVPALLIAIAPNQVPVAARLAAIGAVVDATSARAPDELAALISDLASSPERRSAMMEVGRTLVDGRGASRVAAALRGQTLTTRLAGMADARILWEWANDPEVRNSSFHTEPIGWEDHVRWFERRIGEPTTRIYICADEDGALVGQLRVECHDRVGVIDVSIARNRRGEGLAAPLISAGVRRAFEDLPSTMLEVLVAEIRMENARSARSFEAADFDREERAGAAGVSTYTRRRYE
jgi:spore coat polysaccharide biosynthesis predicted glycosyltransferase SpsG